MANARIDDLRKRLARDPGSRVFAQLAEELRRDGALIEAIGVSRDGLQRHPTYWSARLTLGRCLVDSGDRRAAAEELSRVLQAAPDNLLAGRLLAECQEALEEFRGAAETYARLLPLAPGDKQLEERLVAAQRRATEDASRAQASIADMENRFAPIALANVEDDEFELERPGESVSHGLASPAGAAVAPEAPTASAAALTPPDEMVFEFSDEAAGTLGEPVFRPLEGAQPELAPDAVLPSTVPGLMLTDMATPALATATLAELYQEQGAFDRAIETYREVLRREPGNARARERLAEFQAAAGAQGHSRRAVLERTIARLEALSAALQRLEPRA